MTNPEPYEIIPVEKYTRSGKEFTEGNLITEQPVSLTVNGKVWLTFMCTPTNIEELAVGFLFNEKVISNRDEIADIYVCDKRENVDIWLNSSVEQPKNWRRTSGCMGGYTAAVLEEITPIEPNQLRLTPEKVQKLIHQMFESQEVYRKTGGVHSSALSDGNEIFFQIEDVGRHNTLDKITGKMVLEAYQGKDRVLLLTGRISSEMLQKAARLQASILISRTSPTSLSVDLADKLGITLIGYAKGSRFIVYTHPERIELGE